jgi:outer membrane protein OmpA-like peptidoglycan-associated protein
MKILKTSLLFSTALLSMAAAAQIEGNNTQDLDQINVAFSGDQTRFGVGISEKGDFVADFLSSFKTTYRSNWMAQAWYSDGAGGVELDYHWVAGVTSENDLIENAETFKVNKLFFAIDQNTFNDRKLTLGGGKENNDNFWNVYASSAITGTRLVSDTSVFTNDLITGLLNNHNTQQARTIEDITRLYEHPYEWGLGGRLGKYFDNSLLRLTGGLDYEQGEFSSDQLTVSVDLEKYFSNTGHSIALRVEQLQKSGDFEIDKNDTRAFLMYRYDIGKTYQPTERYEELKTVDEVALAKLKEERRVVVQNKINLSSMAFFNLDSSELRDDAINTLIDVATQIKAQKLGSKINIVGHTCSIGTDDYNQGLSERRAQAAKDFFISQGIDANIILSSGKGESEPAFDNNDPNEQPKNRRVAISFLSLETNYKEAEIPAEDVPVKWVKQPVKIAPSWLARALHNPAKHKRTVDVYRYEETESKTTLGDVEILNVVPTLSDDGLTVFRNSSNTLIDVLNNDSDEENDSLSIVDVSQPINGSVTNNGTTVTYTPNTGFIGTDTFQYTVDDGFGTTVSAQVTVTVENNLPTANNDSAIATGSDPLIISVLDNDTDTDGTLLSIVSVSQGQNGQVNINTDSTVTYQANNGFVGTDSFSYTINDEDGGQSTATVNVTVESSNHDPLAIDDLYLVPMNHIFGFTPLENDSDEDGNILTVLSVDTTALQGTLTVNEDGSMRYDPPFLFRGNDTFTYTISDGNGGTATATVVMCVAD